MAGLGDLFSLIAEEKKNQKIRLEQKQVREEAEQKILDSFSKLLENITKEPIDEESVIEESVEIVSESHQEVVEEPKKEIVEVSLGLIGGDTSTKTIDPLTPLDQKFVTFDDLQKHYKTYIARIQQQMSTLGGGGEVNLRYLDDVDRASIFDNRYLRYNGTTRKFEFAEVNPHDIVYTTTLVTTPTYLINDSDYYVGVDYAGPTTITLPSAPSSGRGIIIKDESGNAETNPITVVGTVDNDTGGFVIQLNNGGIQMIYRNGWRIV